MPAPRRLQNDELLSDGVAGAHAQVKARQKIVDIAFDQVQPVLERGVEGMAQIVGIDDFGEIAELLRQGEGLDPGQDFMLLNVEREFGNSPIDPM